MSEYCPECHWEIDSNGHRRECVRPREQAEQHNRVVKLEADLAATLLQISELQKKLAQVKEATCMTCGGSGEIGLADGEIACNVCGGSGDPLHPGIFAKKQEGKS